MAKQTINIGTAPNDGTGTPLRTAFDYCNLNFTELYTAVGPSGNNIVVPGTATITGVLTAGTNSIIGTGSTQNAAANRGNLTIGGTSSAILNLSINGADTGYVIHDGANITFNNRTNGYVEFFANGLAQHRIAPLGVFSWYDGAGGTRMTLNSTGLGVGGSPSTRLHISNSGDVYARIATTSVSKAGVQLSANGVVRSHLLYDDGAGTTYLSSGTGFGGSGQALVVQSGTSFQVYTNNQLATAQMTIDSSGNVGVGVTPRAWATGYRALNLGIYTALTDAQGGATYLTNNAYYDTTDSRWEAVTNNRALRYDQDTADGGHKWYSAPSVAANTALVWSNPMILDASGNLIWSPASTPPTLATNGQLTVNATSNTNLRFSYRGSDGTTRVANITLA